MIITIPLTRGESAVIDEHDYEIVKDYPWHLMVSKGIMYARCHKKVLMHRIIMGVTDPKIKVDHIDHNGLNNSRSNLRLATHGQNNCNSRKGRRRTSIYKGVHWDSSRGKWYSQLTYGGKKHLFLGRFDNEADAAERYNEAALEYHGEFANLNPTRTQNRI